MGEVRACIALGSNLGDRRATLAAALGALGSLSRTTLVSCSEMIETEPVGPVPQGPFLNAAALLRTSLSPRELLDALQEIEVMHGRQRRVELRWGPRTLDLDLLLYGDEVIDRPGLVVPHPRLHERFFVLAPLVQIAPDVVVPTVGRTVRALYEALAPTGPPR